MVSSKDGRYIFLYFVLFKVNMPRKKKKEFIYAAGKTTIRIKAKNIKEAKKKFNKMLVGKVVRRKEL